MSRGTVWETQPNQASWMMKKILKASQTFTQAGITERAAMMITYSIKKMYVHIREEYPKVDL